MCLLVVNPSGTRKESVSKQQIKYGTLDILDNEYWIGAADCQEAPKVRKTGDSTFVWLGTPFFRSQPIESNNIADFESSIVGEPGELNGTFFIAILSEHKAFFLTDRFGSVPVFFYCSDDHELILSTGYQCLLNLLSSKEAGGIVETAVYEFIYMRRLFGTKSYHENVRCLPAGTATTYQKEEGSPIVNEYWSPRLVSLGPASELPELLAKGLRGAANLYMPSDRGQYGLMLSGGLDSRILLALGKDRYKTFTTARTQNNENDVAMRLSNLYGAEHHFLRRDPEYMAKNFNEAILASNAMTVFYECQFVGFAKRLATLVDTIHMGICLDIFFCGHYMFKYRPNILGRPALFFRRKDLSDDKMGQLFLENISYRLKTSKIGTILKEGVEHELKGSLLQSITNKLQEGRSAGFESHQLWEYMHLTDIGRHYSMLMARSLSQHLPVQVPCLENNLYEIAFALPVEAKQNWGVYLAALKQLAPDAMRERNSNTNIRAGYGLHWQTSINVLRSAAGQVVGNRIRRMPRFEDRSWPAVKDDLNNDQFSHKLKRMANDGAIASLSFIDPDKVRAVVLDHQERRTDHAVLLGILLTLEEGLFRL